VSTILKALKRLDEQKRSEAAPRTLQEQVLGARAGGADPDAIRNKWLFVAGGFAAALLLAGASWIAVRGPLEASSPSHEASPPTPAAPAQRTVRADARPAEIPRDDPAPGAGSRAPSARDDLGERVAAHVAPPEAEPSARQRLPDAHGDGAAPAPEPAPPRVAQRPSSVVVPTRREAAQAAPNTSGVRESTARTESERTPRELPDERPLTASAGENSPGAKPMRAPEIARSEEAEPVETPSAAAATPGVPPVRVDRTQWHPAPEKRSAQIRVGEGTEPRELREGDAVNGVVVKEIRPSGVVFVHAGNEFKRDVGAAE
jgi:hypothetical protein